MKRNFLSSLLIVLCMSVTAQTQSISSDSIRNKTRSIFLEFLGPSNLIGISYDSRFNPRSSFGYRIGVSCFAGGESSLFGTSSNYGIFFPVEVNYLLGKKKHKFEIGTGVEIGYCSKKVNYLDLKSDKNITESTRIFGYYFYSNIGYRYQAYNGFQFRIGINPTFSPDTEHAAKRNPCIAPYISFGYAF